MKKNYVYILIHTISGMKYIGAHHIRAKYRSPLEDLKYHYTTSSKLINSIIEKEGKDIFVWQILHEFDTKQEAFEKENSLLQQIFKKDRRNYYNKIFKSVGQISLADLDLSGIKNPHYGKIITDWTGRHHSTASKAKQSKIRKVIASKRKQGMTPEQYKAWCMEKFSKEPEKNGMYGRKRTEEEKRKIRESRQQNMIKGNKLNWKGWFLIPSQNAACISLDILSKFLKAGNLPRGLYDHTTKDGKLHQGLLSKGIYFRELNPPSNYQLINNIEAIERYWRAYGCS